jgi:ubiquinone/menaquinone biosynthesis C-methylase UbiE
MLPRRLLKLAFYLLYHQLAWSYDVVAWLVSFGQWAGWRRLALRLTRPGPTLELAYGTGGLFVDMLDRGYHPVGIDLSPYMARLAGNRLRRRGLPASISRARAQGLPFPAGKFSNIIATFPTPYIFDPETLAEIERVMHSEGRLIIVMEGQLQGLRPLRALIDWLYIITNQRGYHTVYPASKLKEHQLAAQWQMVEHQGVKARCLIASKRSPLFSE